MHGRAASPLLDEGLRPGPVQGGAAEPAAFAQPDYAVTGLAQPHGVHQHRLEHGFQFARRRADDLQYLRCRRLLLQGFRQIVGTRAQLAEQACILDGDDRLTGEARHQIDLLACEPANGLPENGDRTDEPVLLQHRHKQDGPGAAEFDQLHDRPETRQIVRLLPGVCDVNRLTAQSKPAQRIRRRREYDRIVGKSIGKGRRQIQHRGETEAFAFTKKQIAELGVTYIGRARQNGLEHRLQFTRRRADDLQHFGGRGLVLQRFAQFSGPLFNLVLQIRIGFLQARAHVVELVGEAFQFVAGPNRNALGEIAAADALGSRAQGLDRTDHAAGQEDPRQHREDRRRRQHDGEALQGEVQRGVGLLHRQFDEHGPAERLNRRGSRQHLLALDVPGALQRFEVGLGASGLRRLHLQQFRHVGIAQHETDVGMRDQPASRTDDIGMTVLADLDLRDHVPDQLQIDLGDADAGILAGAGQRQRHIGLGLPAEIDRPVIDLVGDGLGEFRILGKVEA